MHPITEKTLLVKYLRSHADENDFPNPGVNHYQRFVRLEEHLNTNVHNSVNVGAAANNDGWLTDHGEDHIATVIRRASDLSMTSENETLLSPYETFILLLACHFHDVGNVFGREEHEKKIPEVLKMIGSDVGRDTLGRDTAEIRMITHIATAHGGYVDDEKTDKDTINQLRQKWPSNKTPVRVTLLAAILRFADELADDHTRANRFMIESKDCISKSEVYHAYADRLKQVLVRPLDNTIQLRFELTAKDVDSRFRKGRKKVFLFDELAMRALKLHHEHVYCSRFFAGLIHIDSILVSATISPGIDDGAFLQPLDVINFTMQQVGYPDNPTSLSDLAPEIGGLTGAKLKTKIARLIKQ